MKFKISMPNELSGWTSLMPMLFSNLILLFGPPPWSVALFRIVGFIATFKIPLRSPFNFHRKKKVSEKLGETNIWKSKQKSNREVALSEQEREARLGRERNYWRVHGYRWSPLPWPYYLTVQSTQRGGYWTLPLSPEEWSLTHSLAGIIKGSDEVMEIVLQCFAHGQ